MSEFASAQEILDYISSFGYDIQKDVEYTVEETSSGKYLNVLATKEDDMTIFRFPMASTSSARSLKKGEYDGAIESLRDLLENCVSKD